MVAVFDETRLRDSHDKLTTREQQVVDLVVQGYANKEVAYALGIAVSTVAVHLKAATRKLSCNDRGTLIRVFRRPAPRSETLEIELSRAEREVKRLLCAGLSTSQIAAARRVSYPTIAKQLDSIYRKAHVSSRWELLARLSD